MALLDHDRVMLRFPMNRYSLTPSPKKWLDDVLPLFFVRIPTVAGMTARLSSNDQIFNHRPGHTRTHPLTAGKYSLRRTGLS